MGSFSITYNKPGDFDSYAVDWDWLVKDRWEMSSREYGPGHGWYRDGNFNDIGRKVLLTSFNLKDLDNLLSIDRIAAMSPAELARLGGVDIMSHTMGDSRMASQVDPRLRLFLCEKEYEGDFHTSHLDVSVELLPGDKKVRKELILPPDQIATLASVDKQALYRQLFSLFGVTDLRDKPGLPKGPYYKIEPNIANVIKGNNRYISGSNYSLIN